MATATGAESASSVTKTECMSRAFLKGLGTGAIVFAMMYFSQRTFVSKRKILISTSTIFAILAGAVVGKDDLAYCQKSSK